MARDNETVEARIDGLEVVWKSGPGEKIIAMTTFRDLIVFATNENVYVLFHSGCVTPISSLHIARLMPDQIKVV